MCDGQVQLAGLNRQAGAGDELTIQFERRFMFAQSHLRRGVGGCIRPIVGFCLQQFLQFRDGLLVLVPAKQCDRVIISRGLITRRQGEHRLEQNVGIVQHIMRQADPRQQAHAFDVIAMLQQIRPHHGFGGRELAIGEQRGRRDDLARKVVERLQVPRGHGGVLGLGRHLVQRMQHAPTGRQRRIDVDRGEERVYRPRRVTQRHVAMAALLV